MIDQHKQHSLPPQQKHNNSGYAVVNRQNEVRN